MPSHLLGGLVEQEPQGSRCGLVHSQRDVRIEIEGDADLGVAEHLAHDFRMYALGEEQRCRRVTQVVKTDLRE